MNFQFKNKVTLKVSEIVFKSLITESARLGIDLEKIFKEGDNYFFTLSFKDYRILSETPYINATEIVKRKGAGYFAYLHRKRYGFYIGAFLSLLIFIYLTSCIWVVDVVGNEETPTEKIKAVLRDNGIGVGKIRYGKKISEIKNRSLLRLDSLAWLWVHIDGTRAVVEVREKGDTSGIFVKDGCVNLVASHTGIVKDMCVRHGRKVVERGDVVLEGDLLVSGVASTKARGIRYIHSQGEIIALTRRRAEGKFDPFVTKRVPTGKSVKRINVEFFEHSINNIFKRKIPFKSFDKKIRSKQIKILKNIYLPLTFTTEEFYEIIEKNEHPGKKAIIERSVGILKNQIESERNPGARTISTEYEYTGLEDGRLYISVVVESEENIAREVKIQMEIPEEYASGESN